MTSLCKQDTDLVFAALLVILFKALRGIWSSMIVHIGLDLERSGLFIDTKLKDHTTVEESIDHSVIIVHQIELHSGPVVLDTLLEIFFAREPLDLDILFDSCH